MNLEPHPMIEFPKLQAIVAFRQPEMAHTFFQYVEALGLEEMDNTREDTALTRRYWNPRSRNPRLAVLVVYSEVYPTRDDDRALNIRLTDIVSRNQEVPVMALERFPNALRVRVMRSMREVLEEVCGLCALAQPPLGFGGHRRPLPLPIAQRDGNDHPSIAIVSLASTAQARVFIDALAQVFDPVVTAGYDYDSFPGVCIRTLRISVVSHFLVHLVHPANPIPVPVQSLQNAVSTVRDQNPGASIYTCDFSDAVPSGIVNGALQNFVAAIRESLPGLAILSAQLHQPPPVQVQQPRDQIQQQPENREGRMADFRPRLILLLEHANAFAHILANVFRGRNNLIERSMRDDAVTTYRIRIDPGITTDDYIWCVCPNDLRFIAEAEQRILRWVARNGDEAFGIIHSPGMPREVLEGNTLKCLTVESVETQVKRLLRMIPGPDANPPVQILFDGRPVQQQQPGQLQFRNVIRPDGPVARAREDDGGFFQHLQNVFNHMEFQMPPPPFVPPGFVGPEVVDLSAYDPDDRVAIEAVLEQNVREGLVRLQQQNVFIIPENDNDEGGPEPMVINQEQRARERALDARLAQDAAIRNAYEARRRGVPLFDPAPHQPRRIHRPVERVVPAERVYYHLGGDAPVRLEPAPIQVPPRPQPRPQEGGGDIEIIGQGVHRDIGDDAMQGRLVGQPRNNQLRDRIHARNNARAAQQLVNADPAVKKMVAPRMEKSDDVDAVAMTAEDNTCTVCLQSHVTTMLFPCLHYLFCAGCVGVWQSGGNKECPICRTEIKMVLQPRGKVSIDELRARSAVPVADEAPVAAVAVAVAEAAPAPAPAPGAEGGARALPFIPPVPAPAPTVIDATAAAAARPPPKKRAKKEAAPRRSKSAAAPSRAPRKPKKK